MHTKDNQPVAVNDRLWLEVVVNSTNGNPDYCNCTVETVEPMFPGNDKTVVTINTRQAVKTPTFEPKQAKLVAGFSFMHVEEYAKKALAVLKAGGDHAIELIKMGFAAYTAFCNRDLTSLFAALKVAGGDLEKVKDAIKAEFQIE